MRNNPTSFARKCLAGLNLLLALALAALIFQGYQRMQQEKLAAAMDGRLVRIDVSTGAVEGGLKTAAAAAEPPAPPPPEPVVPAPSPPAASPPDAEPPPTEPAQSSPLPAETPAAPAASGSSGGEEALVPSGAPLNAAPGDSVTEQTPEGPLPKIAADGTKPWQYYARPFQDSVKGNRIAVLVVGLGLSRTVTEEARGLPPGVSLSFSPYAPDLAVWVTSVRTLGHEIFVDLPLEPADYPAVDPGPYALLSSNSPQQNEKHIHAIMARAPGFVGMYLPADQQFAVTKEELALAAFRAIAARGVIGIAGDTSQAAGIMGLLNKEALPFLQADTQLQAEMTAEDAINLLNQTESIGRQRGQALLVVHAAPGTLRAVRGWLEHLGEKGFILVPVSALARMKFS